MSWRCSRVAAAVGVGELAPAVARHRKRRSRLPDGGRRRRGALRACGRRCSPASSASLCYNFFFLPPLYTFTIADPTNVVAFVFFTVVAVIVSQRRGARARPRPLTARASARARPRRSIAFSRKLAGVGTLDDVLWATAYQTALMLKVRVVLLLPEDGTIAVKAGYPPEDILDDADLAAAKWAWENNRPAGRGSDTLPGAKRLFLPMRTGRGADRRRRHRQRQAGPAAHARRAPPARCADRPGARSPSSGSTWSRTWTGPSARPRPSGCARRCSPRSRTI